MRHFSIIIYIFSCLVAAHGNSQEAGTKARLAFEHWYCHSIIAFMSESKKQQFKEKSQTHAATGIVYARDMFADLEKFGADNQENWSQNAPFIWGYYLNNGPSTDFIIGRLYEQTQNSAYDDINKNMDGTIITDKKLRQSAALDEYEKRNCKILK